MAAKVVDLFGDRRLDCRIGLEVSFWGYQFRPIKIVDYYVAAWGNCNYGANLYSGEN